MADDLTQVRNIGIMAHIDAGKTTVSERILYFSGKTYKIGEVHDGTAVMDYLEEEQQRGITITSAATKCPWKGYDVNLIDTPGHVDFTAEVERSLRVLDGAVAVFDASEGVQAQSETVWRQGQKYHLSCLVFINKMDKTGADFEMCMKSIRDKLLAHPVAVQMPIGQESSFQGMVDLITMKAVHYQQEDKAASFREEELPAELSSQAAECRHAMLEAVAEFDEELLDLYLHDKPIPEDVIHRAIRKGTVANKINPVLVGSALKNMGVRRLLDAVVHYLPSPLDKPPAVGFHGGNKNQQIEVVCDPRKPLVALAFKVVSDKHGDLYFLRIYQGTLSKGVRVYNPNRKTKENVTRLFHMHASDRLLIDSAVAGDIVAALGLKDTLTGDTLCDSKEDIMLETITFPETVISMSIEPVSAAERNKLGEALTTLRKEDPTFKCKYDTETGQTIISGMGELHLEILQNKLIRDLGVKVRVGKPRVAYKEAIVNATEGEGKFIRQTGGRGQYGHVVIRIEPLFAEDGHYAKENEFENAIIGGTVPKEYIPAIENGVMEGLSSGSLAGYPVVGVKVTLLDGSFHTVDSSELAFEQAAIIALRDLLPKAKPVLLEPVMRVQVIVPEQYFGVVQGNLVSKRGEITNSHVHGGVRVIDGKVPLGEMFGYSSQIRSATAGRGTFTMEPLNYERVPEQVSEKILMGSY